MDELVDRGTRTSDPSTLQQILQNLNSESNESDFIDKLISLLHDRPWACLKMIEQVSTKHSLSLQAVQVLVMAVDSLYCGMKVDQKKRLETFLGVWVKLLKGEQREQVQKLIFEYRKVSFDKVTNNDNNGNTKTYKSRSQNDKLQTRKDTFYRALYSFTGTQKDELTFQKNQILQITDICGDWWMASDSISCGLVPSNYLEKIDLKLDLNESNNRNNVLGKKMQSDCEACLDFLEKEKQNLINLDSLRKEALRIYQRMEAPFQ